MELSKEMIDNGWVIVTDEFGQKICYNKKFEDKFLSEEKTDKPLISTKIVMIDFSKDETQSN